MKKRKIAIMDNQEEGADGFMLISWDLQENGNYQVALNHSDPGNLLDVERSIRVLARLLTKSESPLYNLVGQFCLASMDKAIDDYTQAATAQLED